MQGRLISHGLSFTVGLFSGNELCRYLQTKKNSNEKVKINIPSPKEISERVPKAVTAATKEILDAETIKIE